MNIMLKCWAAARRQIEISYPIRMEIAISIRDNIEELFFFCFTCVGHKDIENKSHADGQNAQRWFFTFRSHFPLTLGVVGSVWVIVSDAIE